MLNSRFVSVPLLLLLLCTHTSAFTADRVPGPPRLLSLEELPVPVDSGALLRQYAALSAMPLVTVTYSPRGSVELVRGDTGLSLANVIERLEVGEPAPEILRKFQDILLATGDETLTVSLVHLDRSEYLLRFDQYISGRPVVHGGLGVTVDAETGLVRDMGAHFLPDRGLPREPALSPEEASALARRYLESSEIARAGTVELAGGASLAYFGVFPDSTRGQLVWAVKVAYWMSDSHNYFRGVIWIDAIDGSYVGSEPLGAEALSRTELPRLSRRLHYLRGWRHGDANSEISGGVGASRAHGASPSSREPTQ